MFPPGSGHFCPRCDKRVYFAEEVIALGEHWHKTCFLCANPECNKRLDARSCCDHDGRPFCQHCHRRLFGPKGYGFGIGAGTLSSEASSPTSPSPTSECENQPPEFARAQMAPLIDAHGQYSPRSSLSPTGSSDGGGSLGLGPGGDKVPSRNHHALAYSAPPAGPRKTFAVGQKDICPRCGKQVYFAEKIMGGGSAWHKMTCFTCFSCNKRLQSTNLCEKESELYCKTCYGRQFGPKGYGFGVGAGTLSSEA